MPLYLGMVASPWRDDPAFAPDFEPPRVPPTPLTPRPPAADKYGIIRTGKLTSEQETYWGRLARARAGYSRDDESRGGSQKKTMEAVWRRDKWLRDKGYLRKTKLTAAQIAAMRPPMRTRELPLAHHTARLRFLWKTGRPVPQDFLPKPRREGDDDDDWGGGASGVNFRRGP